LIKNTDDADETDSLPTIFDNIVSSDFSSDCEVTAVRSCEEIPFDNEEHY
jgi:hypothetical protein